MLRAFTVFNVAQVEGIEAVLPEPETPPLGAIDTFVTQLLRTSATAVTALSMPRSRDFIALPNPSDFTSPEHYEATKLHELVHWSGGEKRLNRDLNNRFGTKAYAAEELIAELGAAFLCAHLGVEGQLRHAEYIASWLSLLKEDDHAIFTAASKASAAAHYLRAFSEPGTASVSEADTQS
jgi:antirestriction protein ArdC